MKSVLMYLAETFLPTPLLTRVRFRLYGKWGDQLDGIKTISGKSGCRTEISGLLRVLSTRSPVVEECLIHRTEDSVFDRPGSDAIPRYMVGGRTRLATCSGVSWFSDRHLAVVNYHGGHARIYRVNGDLNKGRDLELTLLHQQDHPFAPPEDVAVSRDGRLLAVTHSPPGDDMTTLHRVDPDTLELGPVVQRLRRGTGTHGVTVSPDARHLLFTEVSTGMVQVYDISKLPAKRTQAFVAPVAPRVPKSVAVTPDGRYVCVVHATELAVGKENLVGSRLAIHRFDAERGEIEQEPVVLREGVTMGLAGPESCTFLRGAPSGPYLLAICDQAADLVIFFRFVAEPPRLEQVYTLGGISFPHGVDGNPAGTLMAVACYGDDTLRMFKIPDDDQLNACDERPHVLLCDTTSKGGATVPHSDPDVKRCADALTDHGYRVTCLVSQGETDAALAHSCDRVVQLDVPTATLDHPFDEQNAARLETFVREESVRAIHVCDPAGMAALEAGRRSGIPTVLHLTGVASELLLKESNDPETMLLRALQSRADFQITDSTGNAHASSKQDNDDVFQLAGIGPEFSARLAAFYEKILVNK